MESNSGPLVAVDPPIMSRPWVLSERRREGVANPRLAAGPAGSWRASPRQWALLQFRRCERPRRFSAIPVRGLRNKLPSPQSRNPR